jgi:type II secretory pathway component PulK
MTRKNHHYSKQRKGAVLVTALVCLLIVMALLGSMLQNTLRARRQLRTERDLRQAELLLQAGADRAAFRLSKDADYRGETWKLPAKSVIGSGEAEVVIEVSHESEKKPWQVHVVAEYPVGSELSIRRSHTFLIQSSITSN